MRRLHLDCPSGIAGDMLLASLIDLGAPLDEVRSALDRLDLPEAWSLRAERVSKRGVSALQVIVEVDGKATDSPAGGDHAHDHQDVHHNHGRHAGHRHGHRGAARDGRRETDHGHGHSSDHHGRHVHRPYREIRRLIERAELPERARNRALRVFARLAEAEGAVHGIAPEDVQFHEVGSTDAIIDVVGSCVALELLDIGVLTASPLHVGRGFVNTVHGRLPVPAPATLRLLEGLEAYQTDVAGELVTPTGAALVSALCERVGPMPAARIAKVGCGAGRMELPIPNVLRALLCESGGSGYHGSGGDGWPAARDEVVELEVNLDDLSPQLFPVVSDRMLAAGAKDVWVVPATMKKGRPGWVLHVLAAPGDERSLAEIVFRETTTLGMRVHPSRRWTLERQWVTVETAAGPVRVKVGRMAGEVTNIAPEFEDCFKVATQSGIPVKTVMEMAREGARKVLDL